MNYIEIYKQTENYVTELFEKSGKDVLSFHNVGHTRYVVSRATEIAAHYRIMEDDMLVVYLAAWFHDTGYLFTTPSGHEMESIAQMKIFAQSINLSEEIIAKTEGCIMATLCPRNPQGLLQEIVADADTFNLGTKYFKETNKLVKEEAEKLKPGFTTRSFDIAALQMLKDHKYFTSYCNDLLGARKRKNMKKLKKKIKKNAEEEIGVVPEKLMIDEKQGTTKGMQTMLRLTSANHIRLSEMADSKANILISVNAIIISVILSVLLRKLQADPYLTIPTMVFLASSVFTIVIAIMATRPKLNTGLFSEEDVRNKTTNLLFFGNFHRMEYRDYENAMKVMMQDADYLYGSMLQDIYNLGTVLGKKYKLIRLAYTIFMIGIVASVLAFTIASIVSGSAPVEVPDPKGASPF